MYYVTVYPLHEAVWRQTVQHRLSLRRIGRTQDKTRRSEIILFL
jgi:hypothetical protein